MRSDRPGLRGMPMDSERTDSRDRFLALICEWCPLCRNARRRGKGIAYEIVHRLEKDICPFCRAYERVYGRPACEGEKQAEG